MFDQFLAGVITVEGEEMAAITAEKLQEGKTAFMALHEARREVYAATLAVSDDILSSHFDSAKG